MSPFPSLRPPSPWPPPECPQREMLRTPLERAHLIDRLVGWRTERRARSRFVADVLLPIEQQIVDQLIARQRHSFWPDSTTRQRIADLLGAAVAKERGISPFSVHPDDPIELLFWGSFDDLSPLVFALDLKRELGIELSEADLRGFLANPTPASELVEFCALRGRFGKYGTSIKSLD